MIKFKKKSRTFWISLFVFDIVFLLVMFVAWFAYGVHIDLRDEKREIVLGVQRAPVSMRDWFALECEPDSIDVNSVHRDILAPLQTNYSDYTNCSLEFEGNHDGWLDSAFRNGDEAYGRIQGRFFYATKAEQGADFYLLVDSTWYHYLDPKSCLFVDFQDIAKAASEAQFKKLPTGEPSTHQGFVFESYKGESEDEAFSYEMQACGHLSAVRWDGNFISHIKNIGKVSVDAQRFVDFDNVVEVEDWNDIFNQARKSEDAEHLE